MKVVINNCFGGYSLSPKAIKRLAELQGKPCYFFKDGIGDRDYQEITLEEAQEERFFFSAFNVQNPKDHLKRGDWRHMSDQEKEDYNNTYTAIHLSPSPDDRTDRLLLQVIEELGEEANGGCAKLKIIEIPDDIKWEIDEYDGIESIHEKHRSWS